MKKAAYIIVLFAFTACVKDRQCECKNSNNTYNGGTVKTTRHDAKKRCESLSSGDTKCYLK